MGPVRISLKAANQKSKKYTLCVYVQESCVEVKDRVLYEVVQLAVSHDAAPIELIATEVGKDGIVGYVEVPGEGAGAIGFYRRYFNFGLALAILTSIQRVNLSLNLFGSLSLRFSRSLAS